MAGYQNILDNKKHPKVFIIIMIMYIYPMYDKKIHLKCLINDILTKFNFTGRILKSEILFSPGIQYYEILKRRRKKLSKVNISLFILIFIQ